MAKEMHNTRARNVSLPKELDAALVKQAQAEDRKISRVVAKAVTLYLATAAKSAAGEK